jgi:hypothetical protein
MYVYKSRGGNVWEVGYYDPKGAWNIEGNYPNKSIAAQRVSYLNGSGRWNWGD